MVCTNAAILKYVIIDKESISERRKAGGEIFGGWKNECFYKCVIINLEREVFFSKLQNPLMVPH
jgi:hypothetical protein